MGYTITGRLIDAQKQPVEFGQVYTSDANGKPIAGTKNAQTDDQGRWKLDNITDADFITGRMVGYLPKTVAAKSIIPLPNVITGLLQRQYNIILPDDAKATLPEVEVKAPLIINKPNNVGKYVMIGGAVVLGIAILAFGIKALANSSNQVAVSSGS